MGKANKRNKKTKKEHKLCLSGESLMVDALKRIRKINGKPHSFLSNETFDEFLPSKNIYKTKHLNDLPQRDEITYTDARVPIHKDKDETLSSQDQDYVDFKVDKEILNFEKKLIKEISYYRK